MVMLTVRGNEIEWKCLPTSAKDWWKIIPSTSTKALNETQMHTKYLNYLACGAIGDVFYFVNDMEILVRSCLWGSSWS